MSSGTDDDGRRLVTRLGGTGRLADDLYLTRIRE
jgi:hypothetical protein